MLEQRSTAAADAPRRPAAAGARPPARISRQGAERARRGRSATARSMPPDPRPQPRAGEQCGLKVLVLAATFAAMLALPAVASARWLTVEIVVFDDLYGEGLHDEHWPADPGEPSLEGAVEIVHSPGGEAGGAARAYRLVNRSALALDGIWRSLRRSARYRPFLHVGWRQRGLPPGTARPAHVGPHLGDRESGAAGPGGGERPTVQGTVKVSVARYLHVDLDLVYRRPGNGEAETPGTAPARFRLVSERRMRYGDLHYFDHPLFGVLMRIRPLRTTWQFPPTGTSRTGIEPPPGSWRPLRGTGRSRSKAGAGFPASVRGPGEAFPPGVRRRSSKRTGGLTNHAHTVAFGA